MRVPSWRRVVWLPSSQNMATRISVMTWSDAIGPRPLSLGSHESNLPSICLNLNEHMKNTHRQKITSTIGTTLIATGFSLGSCEPAMVSPRQPFSGCAAATAIW